MEYFAYGEINERSFSIYTPGHVYMLPEAGISGRDK